MKMNDMLCAVPYVQTEDALHVLEWMRLELSGKQVPREILDKHFCYRTRLYSKYYHVSLDDIAKWRQIEPEMRRSIWPKYHADGYVFRTLFDYHSYSDCFFIFAMLAPDVDFRLLRMLDFGCLAADYGYFFGILGAHVTLCDFEPWANFAKFRLENAGLNVCTVYAPADYADITAQNDLVCFGEVLEHLKDPLHMLQCCLENHVAFIYTSCYPYGNEAYFHLSGHTWQAESQASACLKLLQTHYEEIVFKEYRRLWILKDIVQGES